MRIALKEQEGQGPTTSVRSTAQIPNAVWMIILFSGLNVLFLNQSEWSPSSFRKTTRFDASSLEDLVVVGTTTSRRHPNARICHSNPYLQALVEQPARIVSEQMLQFLDLEREKFGAESMDPKYRAHTHDRFFPFVPMATCDATHLECIGGPCRDDLSKNICGLQEHVTVVNTTATATAKSQEEPSLAAAEAAATSSCVIYSIGGNNEWAFENDLLQRTPCEIHTFDCTGERERFQVPPHPRLHFHHVCLTAYSRNYNNVTNPHKPDGTMIGESWTLLEMQKKLGHNRIDLLKVDIEGWEYPMFYSWPTLDQVVESEEILLPMQIVVEIHYQTQFANLHPDKGDFKTATDLVELQTHLLRMGYAVVVRDDNPHCRHCTELTLIRIHCPESGVYSPTMSNNHSRGGTRRRTK